MTEPNKDKKNNNVRIAIIIALIPIGLFITTFFIKP